MCEWRVKDRKALFLKPLNADVVMDNAMDCCYEKQHKGRADREVPHRD